MARKIGIKSIMTSILRHLCSDDYPKLLKTAHIKITAASLSFVKVVDLSQVSVQNLKKFCMC